MTAEIAGQDAQTYDDQSKSTSAQEEQTFTKTHMEERIKERLRQKEAEFQRKERDANESIKALKSRISDLEKKERDGTATPQESLELEKGKETAEKAAEEQVPISVIPHLVDQTMAKQQYITNMRNALTKDPELKQMLADPNNQRLINDDIHLELQGFENSPQMIKHILKNKNEANLMVAKYQTTLRKEDRSILVEYMKNLSEKLESNSVRPRASSYSPDPDISNIGDSTHDFDMSDYVKNHI